ncbi:MAG: hypothetical protein K9M49_06385 [Candidatus Marinimicrobia bacterium]|nr:hypothetical protein [Candidatus Neomarinimicrobiota bacterium]MCF7851296.1 hypothetical protein [Candidatus Neomarinimicrobiota bacterium]MCF7904764.1 hypothetical protein [Candidatus Neomarinimicrobiota bacterium]
MQGSLLVVATLLVFILGYWLHVLGTPYNAFLLAIHKLIALAGIVVVGIHVYQVFPIIEPSGSTYLLVGVTLICSIATLATGGVLSAVETANPVMLWSHRLLPYITLVLLVMSYMLGRSSS